MPRGLYKHASSPATGLFELRSSSALTPKNIPALRAKGLHRELLEHKGELLPSWYREAVEQELNSEKKMFFKKIACSLMFGDVR